MHIALINIKSVILRSFEKEFNLNKVVSESKSNFRIEKKELSSLYFSQEKKKSYYYISLTDSGQCLLFYF
jgi:DNA-directed RNA polymerase delta subunit